MWLFSSGFKASLNLSQCRPRLYNLTWYIIGNSVTVVAIVPIKYSPPTYYGWQDQTTEGLGSHGIPWKYNCFRNKSNVSIEATSEWVHGKESGTLRQLPHSDTSPLKSEIETRQMWSNVSHRSLGSQCAIIPCQSPSQALRVQSWQGKRLNKWHGGICQLLTSGSKNKAQKVAGDK